MKKIKKIMNKINLFSYIINRKSEPLSPIYHKLALGLAFFSHFSYFIILIYNYLKILN